MSSRSKSLALVLACAALGGGIYLWRFAKPQVTSNADVASDSRADGGFVPSSDRGGSREELDPFAIGKVDVSLSEPAATEYLGDVVESDLNGRFAALLRKTDRYAIFDPYLSRAAREFLASYQAMGDDPPDAALAFLLQGSGAPDSSVARVVLGGGPEDDDALSKAIAQAVAGVPKYGELFVGIGRVGAVGAPRTVRTAVFAVRREYGLAPTTRVARPNTLWRVRGRSPKGFQDARGSVLYPNGTMVEVEVALDGEYFSLQVPSGPDAGIVWLSVDGKFAGRGPGKLLQLSLHVGDGAPARLSIVIPPAEEGWTDVATAERYAFELLNRDRQRLGVGALDWDDELAEIARRHSEDMRDAHFFGHLSPTTGLLGDRLQKNDYRASMFAENLAKNDGIAEAQAALMWSVGHRRNALSSDPTHVGIGMARADEGSSVWYLTQVYAKPVLVIDEESARLEVYRRIAKLRQENGREEVSRAVDIETLAQEGAVLASSGRPLSEVFDSTADEVTERSGRSAALVAATAFALDSLEIPEAMLADDVELIAVGVHQDPKHPRGLIGAVFVALRRR